MSVQDHVPDHALEALARCLLPEIQRFFESEEGQQEFQAWKDRQADKQAGEQEPNQP